MGVIMFQNRKSCEYVFSGRYSIKSLHGVWVWPFPQKFLLYDQETCFTGISEELSCVCKSWTQGSIFSGCFLTWKGAQLVKIQVFIKFAKFSAWFTRTFFYNKSSLEVQLEVCRIWAHGAPGAQVDNGHWELWDQICVRHILETTGPIFIIEKAKATWKPLDPRCALAWSFSLDVPWGLKTALGAQILCSIYVDDHWVDFQD